jgi:hypothetical protein
VFLYSPSLSKLVDLTKFGVSSSAYPEDYTGAFLFSAFRR